MCKGLMIAALLCTGTALQAQDFSSMPTDRNGQTDPSSETIEIGRTIAIGGARNGGVEMKCMACHGRTGQGSDSAPRLAGLPWSYLADQLVAFQKGTRESPVMGPIATRLLPEEMHAVTAWFATRTPARNTSAPEADMRLIEQGGALARSGMRMSGDPITACVMCHGQAADGPSAAVPGLAGQSAQYISDQLHAWQNGTRNNDPLNVMSDIADKLTDEEIEAVAAYYANAVPEGLSD
ncbi:MAG: cytochrome c [Pelagibaca sp.]